MNIDLEAQIRSARRGLQLRPEEVDCKRIAPVFVPASFFSYGNWPGPYCRLRARDIGLTWSVLLPDQTMRYVDTGMVEYWEARGIDWKSVALCNLAEHSGDNPGTHGFNRTNGQVYAIAMMYPDGIGPSRLLLADRLAALFPSGYRVALPEMSCALAFSLDTTAEEMGSLQNMIDHCFQKGTRPLAPGIYAPEDLAPAVDPA